LRKLLLLFCLAAVRCGGNLNAQSIPALAVDATASQHAINPNIYGIANYGLNAAYAEQIQVPNVRWGGDGTTRYNWQVDSSNSGFDWYFMGGSGNANPAPSASVDLMVNTYKTGARQRADYHSHYSVCQQHLSMDLQLSNLGLWCPAIHQSLRSP
jgi:hypothetical protein